jgi:CubicO group peptidase (beta-lactamase class C family)
MKMKKGLKLMLLMVALPLFLFAREEDSIQKRRDQIDLARFINMDIVRGTGSNPLQNFSIKRKEFPQLELESPATAKKYFGGDYSMNVRWFDTELNEVEKPDNPGRYAYYAEITGENGIVMRRAETLFCAPANWDGWTEQIMSYLEYFPVGDIPVEVWDDNKDALAKYSGKILLSSILSGQEGALILSYLHEMHRLGLSPSVNNTPEIMDGDYHARLKQIILEKEGAYARLEAPKKLKKSSSSLSYLSEKQQKKYEEFDREMRALCDEWVNMGGEPFDLLIAKDARIIFHNAFGENGRGVFTTEVATEVASITKLLTGITFARFVDQGIIEIDDHIGDYLPDFPVSGDKDITFRACFTHTIGLWGHASFGGIQNPWMDNSLSLYLPEMMIGGYHSYQGDGYNLAGKAMELTQGKSIFRIMNEQLFQALGLKNTYCDTDLAFGTKSTAYDLAVIAQMVLNKGKYGDLQYFSEETYDKIMPVDLNKFFPNIKEIEWGIGITKMVSHEEVENSEQKKAILSDKIYGHGSATSSTLHFDTKNNIVIGQSRMSGGKDNGMYYRKMLKIIEKHLL